MEKPIKTALVSVTDKIGIVMFAGVLHAHDVQIISTGGTARLLRENGIPVRDVAEVTGLPEMMDGRVKTLHHRIAGGILFERNKPAHVEAAATHGMPAIDMVVVNLYDFDKVAADPKATFKKLIENIDIGGPTMIRAAAKNYRDVAVVTSPSQYGWIANKMYEAGAASLDDDARFELMLEAFRLTARYDATTLSTLQNYRPNGESRCWASV